MNDTELKSLSTIRYEPKGVEITEIKTTSNNGGDYNVFGFGNSFVIVIKINPFRDLKNIKIATFIADTNGNRIGGICYPDAVNQGVEMIKGIEQELRFSINVALWPGTYFIGAGVSEVDSAGLFLHRIIDAVAIRIATESPVTSIGNVQIGYKQE